jgi:uncharacterized protein
MNLNSVVGFDWDHGNWPKCGKHGLDRAEIESCFLRTITVAPDPYPIELEERFNAVGINGDGRKLFIVFTIRQSQRGNLIRPISARYMHEKEVSRYEKRKET